MESSGVLRFFLAASLLCFCENLKITLPKSVTATRGSCVLVKCQTTAYSEVKWYKYQRSGYPIAYSRNPNEVIDEFRGRTSVQGKARDGSCTLRIDDVQQLHNGLGVYVGVHDDYFYDPYTTINVVEPTTQIIVDSAQVEGKDFTANCQTRHSCPTPPKMEWPGFEPKSTKVTNTELGDGFWSFVVTATFRASRRDQGRTLSCKSVFNNTDNPAVNVVALDILYPPTNVEISYSGQSKVDEGSNIKLRCNSESNPALSDSDYKWIVTWDDKTIHRVGRTLFLSNVRRGAAVTCVVSNTVGQEKSAMIKLSVNYPPSIHVNSSCSDLDGLLHCDCRAEAQPAPVISWIIDGRDATSPDFNSTNNNNGTMTVSRLVGLGGNATCRATNHLGEKNLQLPIVVTLMKETAEQQNLVILGTSAALFIVLLVIAVIIFILRKKRQGQEPPLKSKKRIPEKRVQMNSECNKYSVPNKNSKNSPDVKLNELKRESQLHSLEEIYINTEPSYKGSADEDSHSCLYENFG